MKLTSETKMFLGIIFFSIAMIVGAVIYFSQPEPTYTREEMIPSSAYVTGNATASAYLVEFSDLQCPACKAFHLIVKQVLEQYKDKLTFAYRHFPLDQHKQAVNAALAAEAAGKQGKYYEMIDGIFAEDQEKFSPETFKQIAQKLGLDMDQFEKDLTDDSTRKKVDSDKQAGISFGVAATPTFYLNGKKLDLVRPQDLISAVQAALQ